MRVPTFAVGHFGLIFAGIGCAIGWVLFQFDLKAIAIVVVSLFAIAIGDAWDAETAPGESTTVNEG